MSVVVRVAQRFIVYNNKEQAIYINCLKFALQA